MDELQHDLSVILQQTIGHPSLHPRNLTIIPRKKSWLLNLDAVVLADAGNVVDALFMAARAALWDAKVPRTRAVQYRAPEALKSAKNDAPGAMDVDEGISGFDTRDMARTAADFELPDYWDEGEILDGREKWPVCVTLNLVRASYEMTHAMLTVRTHQLPPVHFLDATPAEEASVPQRLHLMYSFVPSAPPTLQAMRFLGPAELELKDLKESIAVSVNRIFG